MTNAVRRLASATLILCACLTGAAAAQTAPAGGEENGQDAGQTPPPLADAGTNAQAKCITENSDFKMSGNRPAFVVELENKCEQRIICRVDVNVSNAKGSAQGHATLILAPKSAGAAAKKSYVLKVKLLGGMAQSARACRVS